MAVQTFAYGLHTFLLIANVDFYTWPYRYLLMGNYVGNIKGSYTCQGKSTEGYSVTIRFTELPDGMESYIGKNFEFKK